MTKINVYLNFNGKTEEAFNFYKSVFGGVFTTLQRFKDVPADAVPPGAEAMRTKEGERIMHIALPVGDNTLMGTDVSEAMGQELHFGNNSYISLHPDNKEEAERIFNALSAGGKIEMAFQKMFWGAYYGSFTDKFRVGWMVNYEEKK